MPEPIIKGTPEEIADTVLMLGASMDIEAGIEVENECRGRCKGSNTQSPSDLPDGLLRAAANLY